MSTEHSDSDGALGTPDHCIPSAGQVTALEQQVAQQTTAMHPQVVHLLDALIDGFPNAFRGLGRPHLQRPAEQVVLMMFATKAFFSLRSARDLLLAGRYAQTQVLNRLLFEECMLAKFYLSTPEEASKYIQRHGARTPKMSEVLKDLQLELLYQDYEELSQHAHSRLSSTYLSVVSEAKPSGWILRSAPEYSERLLMQCAAYSLKYAAELLQVLAHQSNDSSLGEDTRELVHRVKEFLRELDPGIDSSAPGTLPDDQS